MFSFFGRATEGEKQQNTNLSVKASVQTNPNRGGTQRRSDYDGSRYQSRSNLDEGEVRDTYQQPVFNNQLFDPNDPQRDTKKQAGFDQRSQGQPDGELLDALSNEGEYKEIIPKRGQKYNEQKNPLHSVIGLPEILVPEDYIKPTTIKVPRFGLVDVDSNDIHKRPLDFYEGLEKKSDLLVEEMEKQLSLLKKCETITRDFKRETSQLKDRIRSLLENVRDNLGLTNFKDIKDKIFAEIDELVKLCHMYKVKAKDATQIFKMFRDTFPYQNQNKGHSLVQSIESRNDHLLGIIGKDLTAMNKFMDNFKLQAKNEPFAQKTKDAAIDLLQRMKQYEPHYNENQKEIELIYNVLSDVYEKEAAIIEEEAYLFQTSVEKIHDGKLQLIQAASLEEPLNACEAEIRGIVNRMKELFEVGDHEQFKQCPKLIKKKGFDNLVSFLLQQSEVERVKIHKVKVMIKILIDPLNDKGLYFQKQKFKIRDQLDVKIRELEDQLDTNKNILMMVKSIEKEEAAILNSFALSRDLNYQSTVKAKEEICNKLLKSGKEPNPQEMKLITKLGVDFNMLQAEFKNILHKLEKINHPQFRSILGKVFPVFNQKLELLATLCSQHTGDLVKLKTMQDDKEPITTQPDRPDLTKRIAEFDLIYKLYSEVKDSVDLGKLEDTQKKVIAVENDLKHDLEKVEGLIKRERDERVLSGLMSDAVRLKEASERADEARRQLQSQIDKLKRRPSNPKSSEQDLITEILQLNQKLVQDISNSNIEDFTILGKLKECIDYLENAIQDWKRRLLRPNLEAHVAQSTLFLEIFKSCYDIINENSATLRSKLKGYLDTDIPNQKAGSSIELSMNYDSMKGLIERFCRLSEEREGFQAQVLSFGEIAKNLDIVIVNANQTQTKAAYGELSKQLENSIGYVEELKNEGTSKPYLLDTRKIDLEMLLLQHTKFTTVVRSLIAKLQSEEDLDQEGIRKQSEAVNKEMDALKQILLQ